MRFAECTSLRYLNVRNNQFREFPLAVCVCPWVEKAGPLHSRFWILPTYPQQKIDSNTMLLSLSLSSSAI